MKTSKVCAFSSYRDNDTIRQQQHNDEVGRDESRWHDGRHTRRDNTKRETRGSEGRGKCGARHNGKIDSMTQEDDVGMEWAVAVTMVRMKRSRS